MIVSNPFGSKTKGPVVTSSSFSDPQTIKSLDVVPTLPLGTVAKFEQVLRITLFLKIKSFYLNHRFGLMIGFETRR